MIRTLIIFLSAFALIEAHAQVSQPIPSTNGRLTFPESIVCAGYGSAGEIIITTTALECPNGGDPCVIDFRYDPAEGFGNEPGPTAGTFVQDPSTFKVFHDGEPINYTYSAAGTYGVAVLIGAGIGNFEDFTQAVTVLPGTPPDFNIYNCSNNEVQVEITDTNFPQYTVDYDQDNIADVTSGNGMVSPSHAYPAGQMQGIVSVEADYRGCTENTKSVQLVSGAFSTTHLISRLEVMNANEIQLTYQNIDNNILYALERNTNAAGGFSSIDQFTDLTTFSNTGINADQDFYCYRLGAKDVCNNQTFYGNTICSHSINLDVQDGQNVITWETNLAGASSLSLNKNSATLNPGFTNTGLVTDKAIVCGSDYCYRLTTDYGNNIQSLSKLTCGKAKSTQPPFAINEISSVVDGNSVRLDWLQNPDYSISEYAVFRIPTNVGIPYGKTPDLFFTDNTYQPFQGICYQLRFDDACKNRSARSQDVCPIELKATLDESDNSVLLQWTGYAGWATGVDHYVVEKYDGNGQLISSTDNQGQTTFTDNTVAPGQVFTYRIVAIAVSPLVQVPSISNTQTIIKSIQLYHPTAFIPVNAVDERNRTFAVKGIPEYISSYELRIFNRWGEMMFYSTDMERGWDGTFKGVTMPEGTYIFKTKVVDTAGRTFDYSGSVVLFRK
jgi:gliding motility-associated-like protein